MLFESRGAGGWREDARERRARKRREWNWGRKGSGEGEREVGGKRLWVERKKRGEDGTETVGAGREKKVVVGIFFFVGGVVGSG